MGKVKQVIMGDIEAEEKARSRAAKKREQKKLAESPRHSGEPEATPESTNKLMKKRDSGQARMTPGAGKNYVAAFQKIDKSKTYPPTEAIKLIKDMAYAKFNETVELIINVTEKGLRGNVSLPNGTGKEVRVKIADEGLVSAIEKGGKIDFDILVAAPEMMPKLAKIAKTLGPRGLMPNPKTNTISPQPEKLAKELANGQVQFKTETNFPIIHTIIGKRDFEDKKLLENFQTLIKAVGKDKIVSLFLKSTMSPAVKVQI